MSTFQGRDLIDDNGYPTDHALAAIQNWTGTRHPAPHQ